jgi:acetyl esterase/lipase
MKPYKVCVLLLSVMLISRLSSAELVRSYASDTNMVLPLNFDEPAGYSKITTEARLLADAGGAAEFAGETLVYKKAGGRELHLYIDKPSGWKPTDRRTALVFFHGGGWVGGPVNQFNKQSQYLASRGMVCVQVEYRLLERSQPVPPTICCEDAKSAMRYVRSHAGELGIDPNRIGAGGGSAGGHLAAFAGMVPGQDDPQDDLAVSPKPDALVLFNPVLDNGRNGGWGNNRVGTRVKEFSPAANVTSNAPPAILFLGRADKLIPVATMERFQKDMRAVGVRCDLFLYKDVGHSFFNEEPYKTETLLEADKFLESLGWLQGPPTLRPLGDTKEPAAKPSSEN